MATNPETRLTRRITKYLDARRLQGEPVWWLKTHGSGYTRAGTPDLLVCYMGRFLGLEVKVPGGKPTPIQVHTGGEISAAQGVFEVVYSVEDVDAVLAIVAREVMRRVEEFQHEIP